MVTENPSSSSEQSGDEPQPEPQPHAGAGPSSPSSGHESSQLPGSRPRRHHPRRGQTLPKLPYKEAHVLMLCWEEDDLGCWGELDDLRRVFKELYGFHTVKPYLIPSANPDSALGFELHKFIEEYSKPENLLIIYYGGHGGIGRTLEGSGPLKMGLAAYEQCHHPDRKHRSAPWLDWSVLQGKLECAESDVLILLDACNAAWSPAWSTNPASFFEDSRRSGGGRKELIAACGCWDDAPGPGHASFTFALVRVLQMMARENEGQPFSAANLHKRILQHLLHRSPQRFYEPASKGDKLTRADKSPHGEQTPVHITLTESGSNSSILLWSFEVAQGRSGLFPLPRDATDEDRDYFDSLLT